MLPFPLWCAATKSRADARIGFEPAHDPSALAVHAGPLALLLPDGPRALAASVGGPPTEGWPVTAFVEKEPGWFVAGAEWIELVRSQAVFGRVPLHLTLNGAPAGAVEVAVPIEERWRRLYEDLVREMRSDADAEAALRGASGVGRARLDLWRARTPGELTLRILARVDEGLDRVAADPDRRPLDGGGRTPHARGGFRAIAALPQAFRTGAVGLSSEGRPTPLLFPAHDDEYRYDTDLNRAARWVVERLAKAAAERADFEDAESKSRENTPGRAAFGDSRAARRAALSAERLREASRSLRDRLRTEPFLREAARTSRPQFPFPLPPNPGYRVLREALADELALRRGGLEATRIRRLFADAEHDAPALHELYERWVGVALAAALKGLGFAVERAGSALPVPGGAAVAFASPTHGRVRLYATPAIRRDRCPIPGVELRPAAGDPRTLLTPDFVLERVDQAQRRVKRPLLVVDATLSSSPEIHRKKALYAKRLVGVGKRFRLGMARRGPAVAAAVAVHPGRAKWFDADDADLRTGSLPLSPADDAQRALLREYLLTFLDDAFD